MLKHPFLNTGVGRLRLFLFLVTPSLSISLSLSVCDISRARYMSCLSFMPPSWCFGLAFLGGAWNSQGRAWEIWDRVVDRGWSLSRSMYLSHSLCSLCVNCLPHVCSGPSFAREIAMNQATAVVIASDDSCLANDMAKVCAKSCVRRLLFVHTLGAMFFVFCFLVHGASYTTFTPVCVLACGSASFAAT